MNSFPWFIARRIYYGSEEKQVSKPAVFIALLGIAIGLAVMIATVAIIVGFKSQVRDKIVGFGSHLQITSLYAVHSLDERPIAVSDSMLTALVSFPQVKHVQGYTTKPGMLKTDEAFQGMILKGIGADYDLTFFRQHLLEGEIPVFSDSISSNRVVLSRSLADKLKLKVGDKVDTYFIQDNIRARRLT
ncbi:efflux ABC transporter, permease protein, partial [gut metagenome]